MKNIGDSLKSIKNVTAIYKDIETPLKWICKTILLPAASIVYGFFIKNMIWVLGSCICFLVIIIMVLLFVCQKKQNLKIRGSFAVSAVILYEKDNKILLCKANGKAKGGKESFYMQPSMRYKKTAENSEERDLKTPYEKIQEYLNETLYTPHLEFVQSDPLEYEVSNGKQKISAFLEANKKIIYDQKQVNIKNVEDNMYNYRNNEITYSPSLTIVEKNPETLHISKEPFHIDMYYIFKLKMISQSLQDKIDEGEFKLIDRDGLEQLVNDQQTHGDLLAIYDTVVCIVNGKKPRPRIRINTCTFSCKKKTAYWRITENCNCNCQYCFIPNKKKNISVEIDDNLIDKIVSVIDLEKIEKLVISGGEPFLVKNLLHVVKKISESSGSNLKISICSNGLLDPPPLDELVKINKFEKFVISLDGYNQSMFSKFKKGTGSNNKELDKVKKFIIDAQENNIKVAVNVIITSTLIADFDGYIKIINQLGIKELSLSAMIPPTGKKNIDKRFVDEPKRIFDFFNDIINNKLGTFEKLEKLDLIYPQCVYSNQKCSYKNSKLLMYISPDGTLTHGCNERRDNPQGQKANSV